MEDKGLIRFYLFQCPPSLRPTPKVLDNLENFISHTDIGDRFAIEFRNEAWFRDAWERWARKMGVTMVSVDAPEFQNKVFRSSRRVYVRIHGRTAWYHHIYTESELVELYGYIREKIAGVDELYFFLNNNHGMLPTGELIIDTVGRYIEGIEYHVIPR